MEIVNYRSVYFAFGRYQPTTRGHENHFKAMKQIAGSNDWFIFPSLTQGGFEDPLDVDTKIKYIQKAIPWTRGKVRAPSRLTAAGANNPVVATIQTLQQEGYDKCYMVAGSDRMNAFQWTKKRNGTDYSFYEYDIISSGERDADGDTFAISGTKMRQAAMSGNFDAFKAGMPSTMTRSDAEQLMKILQKLLA